MAKSCQKRSPQGKSCIESLAGGWTSPADLCPSCTTKFIAALDITSDKPLNWHSNFRDRARAGVSSRARATKAWKSIVSKVPVLAENGVYEGWFSS